MKQICERPPVSVIDFNPNLFPSSYYKTQFPASKTFNEEQIRWVPLITKLKSCMKNFVSRTPSIFIDCHFGFNMKYLTVVIEKPLNEKCRQH